MTQQLRLISIILCGLLLNGCQTTWTPQQSTLATSHAETLNSLIANKQCDASYQCKVLALGERPACEGPSQYVIYSTKHSDKQALDDIATKITTQERLNNKKPSAQKMCKPVIPVTPLCIKQQCQTYRP
ncbi:hypothetical protein PSECIP111951_03689 [Pseudoalteromonas holothuriae]|uniref:Uncharacterized protein n=1 Tax=Pseudoalteromonas holothuriae TaxID=2963714 RepID=A0A9W4VV96_9GAMM|nr:MULTISPECIES: hypothetical protein [unclassified Pseudoalteromonas]CAH9065349.1 hypothetical protein PSECIP111854_03661 [Pseudoalteromonas sp. CIP111854]CAH9067017.1 hypothetical protein PSECIP111951_03689 [Pseudoalteromonas sp. CIP111951]